MPRIFKGQKVIVNGLRGCPFCGAAAVARIVNERPEETLQYGDELVVRCENKDCSIQPSTGSMPLWYYNYGRASDGAGKGYHEIGENVVHDALRNAWNTRVV